MKFLSLALSRIILRLKKAREVMDVLVAVEYSSCGCTNYRPVVEYSSCGCTNYRPAVEYSSCGCTNYRPAVGYSSCGCTNYRPASRVSHS
jgi:hypothetical protein